MSTKITRQFSVFLVDDNKLFSAALHSQLKDMFGQGSVIRSFHTAEQCLDELYQRPDIIILDYYLNTRFHDAMNGLEALKRIRKMDPSIQVIMLSAQDKMEIAVDSIRYGAYDYIIKNEKVFLRTRIVVKNLVSTITDSTELKSYRFWTKIASGVVLLAAAVCVAIQMNYPGTF
jgi:two-component system, OmpR family, response regulator